MKYQPVFDQLICHELGYSPADGVLIDLIISASSWAKKGVIDGHEYYFLAHDKIIDELPCFFGSKQAVTRSIKSVREVLEVERVGRSNFYRIKPEIAAAWGKDAKDQEYTDFIAELFRKRNDQDATTVPIMERSGCNNRSDNGTIPVKTVPKTEPIKQPINKTTKSNNQREGARERFRPPTLNQVTEYANQRGSPDLANHFFDYYEAGNWKDRDGRKVRSWKQKFITWQRKNETNQRSDTRHQSNASRLWESCGQGLDAA